MEAVIENSRGDFEENGVDSGTIQTFQEVGVLVSWSTEPRRRLRPILYKETLMQRKRKKNNRRAQERLKIAPWLDGKIEALCISGRPILPGPGLGGGRRGWGPGAF